MERKDMMLPELTSDQRERFDRNLRLAGVGEAGQRRLLAATAVVIGTGGLGSPAILYLAAAGVGRLRLADDGRIEPSNLNRQILHTAADVGRPKVDSAREAVLALAPGCRVETVAERIDAASAPGLVRGAGVVLDCSDNFATRLAVADAAWREGVPLVSAAVLRMEGQLLAVIPASGDPCYRCLLPEVPSPGAAPGAAEVGILARWPASSGASGCRGRQGPPGPRLRLRPPPADLRRPGRDVPDGRADARPGVPHLRPGPRCIHRGLITLHSPGGTGITISPR